MKRYICIHGHFYQPPRENPWLEEIELQDSAYPFHDWNERITEECYGPNTASRILDPKGTIVDIINNYSKVSFNFGPTLLSWLEKHKPEVYNAIIDADKASRKRFSGKGCAVAQVYNHMIMPLANERDKETQVVWGIRDFRHRFGRKPEGMWLPETAVDTPTLEVLARHGIRFTILAQRQANRVRNKGRGEKWHEVSGGAVDPSVPYQCVLPSGKRMNIFFYDGPIAHDSSFGKLLSSGEAFANRMISAFPGHKDTARLVHIATDGENYGHHHSHGDMALAYCLHLVDSSEGVKLTNYPEFLKNHPPTRYVKIHENSSWSCVHGVKRWAEDCGCSTGMHGDWHQKWRRPLREALDWLRDTLAEYFEEEGLRYLADPWAARNDYIEVVLKRSPERIDAFFNKNAARELSAEERTRALKLLEMQRNAMLMYTSCGWFFDELSGIETVQVIQYAARAVQLAEELQGVEMEGEFKSRLEKAPSNILENGARVYEEYVKPARVDLQRVGAHYAISSVFEEYNKKVGIFSYSVTSEEYNLLEAGRSRLAMGRASLVSDVTTESKPLAFAVVHLGEQNIHGGVKEYVGPESFTSIKDELGPAFQKGDITGAIRLIDKHFTPHIYNLWHLFRDEQRHVLSHILQANYSNIETTYRRIYEDNHNLMNFFKELNMPVPRPMAVAAAYVLNIDVKRIFSEFETPDVMALERTIENLKKWGFEPERTTIAFVASTRLFEMMKRFHDNPEDTGILKDMESVLRVLGPLQLDLDLWAIQNMYFSFGKSVYPDKKRLADQGDQKCGEQCRAWIAAFEDLGDLIGVRVRVRQ